MAVLDAYPWVSERFELVGAQGVFLRAFCPLKCHRSGPTLKLWVGTSGQLLFGCYAGCTEEGAGKLEILRAVGMGWKDCFPAQTDWKKVRQDITARYRYRDEAGVLLYETVRLEPGRGGRDKDFRQRRPGDGGKWEWSLGDARRVLYQLPELLDPANHGRAVLVVAGEKDADSLARIGVLATTNVCGESSPWLDEYSQTLAGRDVIVVEDRDSAGRRHANEVVGSLLANDVGSVRRCVLPEKDATAFLSRLRMDGVTDAGELKRRLWAALQVARRWQPAAV